MTEPLNLKAIEARLKYESEIRALGDISDLLRALRETRTALKDCVHTIQEEWGEDAAEAARAVLKGVRDD